MKTLNLLKYLLVIVLYLNLQSCSKEETPAVPSLPAEEKTIITCETKELTFEYKGGTQTFSFSTNKDWTVKVLGSATWCKLSQTKGIAGMATINVTTEENVTYNDRNITLTINSAEAVHQITIWQKQNNTLQLGTNRYEVSQDGGNLTIGVKANIDYEVEIAEDAKSWIRNTTSKAITAYSHTFSVSANESISERIGKIYFKSDEQTYIAEVIQAGTTKILSLTKNEYTIDAKGETISVELMSNIDYSIEMPNVDWVYMEGSRALSVHNLNITVKPNESYNKRTAEIIFYDKKSTLKETLTIIQNPVDLLNVSTKEYEIEQEGGDIYIEFLANIDYNITMGANWIKNMGITSDSNSYKKILRIQVTTNNNGDRQGQIIIANPSKGITHTITIKQKGTQNPTGQPNPGGNVEDMGWG